MMDFSAVQIAMVLVIALLVFGPHKLPEIGRQVGRGLREARRQVSEVGDRFIGEPDHEPDGTSASRTTATSGTHGNTGAATADDDADLLGVVAVAAAPDDPDAGASGDHADDLLSDAMTTSSGGTDAMVPVGDGAPGHTRS